MDSSSDTDDFDCELAFATLDLTGVEFIDEDENQAETKEDSFALEIERKFLDGEEIFSDKDGHENHLLFKIQTQLDNGEYISILTGQTSKWLLSDSDIEIGNTNIWNRVRTKLAELKSISECVEAEFFAIAALNIFLQLNYTGPFFEETNALDGIDPHPCFAQCLKSLPVESEKEDQRHSRYQNAVLSELTVDGIWPCQVAKVPYLLLLARCILLTLSHPEKQCWADNTEQNNDVIMPSKFCKLASRLRASPIWSARSTVAHERLLLSREPTTTLWEELESTFPRCISSLENSSRQLKATVLLEYGLACHHFEREKKGKEMFQSAMITSGLTVEVTGQMGKRTKYQTKATAQMVVRAVSAPQDENICTEEKEDVKAQMVQHTEDSILLERVKFDEEVENDVSSLTILDQAIILALCLDVKNNNPSDGLTAEEMSAYLARVLCHHDDWTIYSTALLERAWLEFEGNHTKERAILQLQALADQHTQKLTITQSTRKSIDESSPVQDRLKNVHSIVYPPRWHMLRDVAERYAELGIVTSAAEIFTEIEYWDEVVDCYRRAGKKKRAEEIVRERLSLTETPRMWVALGDISNELSCYEKAIELSNGRFCQAYVSLGEHLFRKGELRRASENYHKALKMRLLLPRVWFRVGTISMQLGDWQLALKAFSEVVQQQPDEGDAWANMAAVHIHEKRPAEAYPALTESLKYSRNNWRIWINKLYICLDLEKYDEATQACITLLDMKAKMSTQRIPDLEEKCVRAIVGQALEKYTEAQSESDEVALDSTRRSLTRIHTLLERICATMNEAWVFEITAFFHEQVGQDTKVFENLMKEYRSLTSVRAWEKDDFQVCKVCQVVSLIVHYQQDGKENLAKSKFLLSGTLKRVEKARADMKVMPKELETLKSLLEKVTNELKSN